MKHSLCRLFLFLLLSQPSFGAEPAKNLSQLKLLSAQLLGINSREYRTKDELYDRYREVIYQHLPFIGSSIGDPVLVQHAKKSRFLGIFAGVKDDLIFTTLSGLVDWGALGLGPLLAGMRGINDAISPWFVLIKDKVRIPDAVIAKLDKSIDDSMHVLKFSQSAAIKMLLDPKEGIDLSKAPPLLARFLDLVLTKYFDALDNSAKRAILADIVILDEQAPADEALGIILNHCGPVIQKAFQLFGKDVKSPKVKEILTRLRQSIKPFPTRQAKETIAEDTGLDIEMEFPSFPEKPLAAATMGQVYLLTNRQNEKLIVKVQRPGVVKKAEDEFKLLRSLTSDPAIIAALADIAEIFKEESDFNIELANLRAGQIYDGKMSGKLKTIREFPEYKSSSKVLFLTLAEGKSIDSYGAEANERKLSALSELLKVWVQEAMFNSRIFHADLHPGNLFFDIKSDDPNEDTITLLDFGSVGYFTLEEAKSLFKLTIGLNLSIDSLVMDGLDGVVQWHEGIDREELLRFVREVARANISPSQKLKDFFDRALEMGILLPKCFIQFYRGQAFLEKQIVEIYQNNLGEEEGSEQARKALGAIYASVFRWEVFWDIWSSACDARDDCTAYVDNNVVLSFFKSFFSSQG